MTVIVLYDSFFGNTEKIARAIGGSLGTPEEVSTIPIGEANLEQLNGLKLLVVGSPTRGFRPTPAIVGFLNSIPTLGLGGVKVAAFDTRMAVSEMKSPVVRFIVNLGGYAAKPIADALKKKGGVQIIPPEGFIVNDREGPLREGELERASEWAKRIMVK